MDAWRGAEQAVVHVNIGLDEPLLPSPIPEVHQFEVPRRRTVLDSAPGPATLQVAQRLMEEERGIVYVGPLARPRERRAARALVQALGWPFWLTLLLACRTSNPPCHGVAGLMEPPRCLVQFFFIWEDAQPTGQQPFLAELGNRLLVPSDRVWSDDEAAGAGNNLEHSAWRSLVWTPRPSRCLRKSNLLF